jgi:hypothetical protein
MHAIAPVRDSASQLTGYPPVRRMEHRFAARNTKWITVRSAGRVILVIQVTTVIIELKPWKWLHFRRPTPDFTVWKYCHPSVFTKVLCCPAYKLNSRCVCSFCFAINHSSCLLHSGFRRLPLKLSRWPLVPLRSSTHTYAFFQQNR